MRSKHVEDEKLTSWTAKSTSGIGTSARGATALAAAVTALAAGTAFAGEVTVPNDFQPNTLARASEVNANFDAVEQAVNDNDSRITANDSSITANAASITANVGAVATVQNAVLDAADNQYVPFKVEVQGGTCNTAAAGSANPVVTIDSDGVDGTFMVTSILMKTDDIPATGFQFLSINHVVVDGTLFDTRTANLTGNAGGTGVLESFDIMGTPVRLTSDNTDHTPGANFPHQIVADSEGNDDVSIRFFCRTDVEDLDILFVAVSGWKRAADTITVNYIPGN